MSVHASKRARAMADVASVKAKLPYISQTALAEVLNLAKKEQLPYVSTRKALRRARDDFVHSTTPYGPIHQRLPVTGSGLQQSRAANCTGVLPFIDVAMEHHIVLR